MKILVATKRVPDTDQKIQVREDGLGIETANLPFVINPFDAIAVEEAIRIRENHEQDVEVVVIGIGSTEYEQELRTALAMGADRAILVETTDADLLDPWNAASILAAVVHQQQPDLVLMGKQAVDDDANQAGQFLAAQLDWPQATFASQLEFSQSGLRVSRETDHGIEVIQVGLPAVVTTDLRLNEPRYASLPGILQARKKEIGHISLSELDIEIVPRIEVLKLCSSLTSRQCVQVNNVDELIDKLRNDAEVL